MSQNIIEYPSLTNYMKINSQNPLNAINIAMRSLFKIR